MLRLLEFLFRRRILGLFLLLEGLSFWLLFSFNNRYNSFYVNSSNHWVGVISEQINSIGHYSNLQYINQDLAEENKHLRVQLAKQVLNPTREEIVEDSVTFSLSLAKVVNSSVRNTRNFLTLRIQERDSIVPGMGVMSPNGVVGRVKSVSSRYAAVTSLLNPNLLISSQVSSNGALCTVQWGGENFLKADLKYVPRHLKLAVGDSVLTSGYGQMFPQGHLIGIVDQVNLEKASPFYDATIQLTSDLSSIHRVYIVKIHAKKEIVELEEEVGYE